MDFLPRDDDCLPYRLEPAGARTYEEADGALVARPDVEALAGRMRWHYDHREDSRSVGRRNRAHAAEWTWDAAARRLAEVLGLS